MRFWLIGFLLVCAALLAAGCGYANEISKVEQHWGRTTSPEPEKYGQIRMVLVTEYRMPRGLSRFPDGGKAFAVARYIVLYQEGGKEEREVGRIHLTPVRTGDFGNMYGGPSAWTQPNQLTMRGEYGYTGSERKVYEETVTIPPLQ